MRGEACNWSPQYTKDDDDVEEESNAYTVVYLRGLDDGNGVVKQVHVYATTRWAAKMSVLTGELRSCEGRVLEVLKGHLEGGS